MSENDLDLLGAFLRDQSQDAFTALVQRHLGLVYSAALRQVRSPQFAEEVAQSVFTDLARNAAGLKPGTILTAWLYQVTRRTAIDVVRREARRQSRERVASELNAMNALADDWTQIEPLLDEAMQSLDEAERTAILLRYFENKSLREVGEALGTTDDAARKRVTRAVDCLRSFFARRGKTLGASGLVAVISANAVQSAPVGLVVTISNAAALTGSTIVATTKAIAMTTAQKVLIASSLACAIGAGIYEGIQASDLRKQVVVLQQQQALLAGQNAQLTDERDAAVRRLAGGPATEAQLNRAAAELAKLRGDIARSKAVTAPVDENDPAQVAAKAWLTRVKQLKAYLVQHPEKSIPEVQFVTDQDWLSVTKAVFETDGNGVTAAAYRHALSLLYDMAKIKFSQKAIPALKSYELTHNGQFPTDVLQLKVHFTEPVDEAVLQRYAVMPRSTFEGVRLAGDSVLAEIASPDMDTLRYVMTANGSDRVLFQQPDPKQVTAQKQAQLQPLIETLMPVAASYAAAHEGRPPANPEQMTEYATTGEQQTALKRLIEIRKEAASGISDQVK